MAKLNVLFQAPADLGGKVALEVLIPFHEPSANSKDVDALCNRVAFYIPFGEVDDLIRDLLKWRSEHVSVAESAS